MPKETDIARLTNLFRKLGAPEPEAWANSQATEGIPQVLRWLFLRKAWRCVVSEQDPSWIDAHMRRADARPHDPYSVVGHVLRSLRAKGATDAELSDLVRGTQAELLFGICYLLDDPGQLEPEVSTVDWGLFQIDENGVPGTRISGLHESVLETDPTGREMRPRS